MDARKYWKQLVQDYLECCDTDVNLTDAQINAVVTNLLNNDHLWTEIDSYVEDEINWVWINKKGD